MAAYAPNAGPSGNVTGLKGTGYNQVRLENLSPQQKNLFSSLFAHATPDSITSRLATGDPSQYGELEAPALRQFQQLIGGLSSQFGGAGLRRSSAYQNAMGTQAQSFAEKLQGQRMAIQRQALSDLFNMGKILLNKKPFTDVLLKERPKTQWWQTLLGGGSPLVGAGLGGLFGGLPGAALGGQLGSSFGSGFLD